MLNQIENKKKKKRVPSKGLREKEEWTLSLIKKQQPIGVLVGWLSARVYPGV